jgi:glycosyltransferase involved in cell wall biosynthesis
VTTQTNGDPTSTTPQPGRPLRVAVAHEWLVKYAGSERCVSEMMRAFPGARLLTTILDEGNVPHELRGAEPSLLQHLPHAERAYQWLVPAMPLAWAARRPIDDVDLVISSSHACAKGVRIAPGIPHLCYCHTPMRYGWDFESEKARFPRSIRPAARAASSGLRRWDHRSTAGVTMFLANSSAVADRILRHYNRTADVLFPPVDTEYFTPGGERDDYFLFVGRFVAYKRPDLVVEAFKDLPYRVIMVGEGHMQAELEAAAGANVTFERDVTPERLRELYRGAQALVYPGEEDFGIVMAEAQACGTPVIGLAAGGALDIVRHGRTGVLLERTDATLFARAVRTLANTQQFDASAVRENAQRFSSRAFSVGLREAVRTLVETGARAGRRK